MYVYMCLFFQYTVCREYNAVSRVQWYSTTTSSRVQCLLCVSLSLFSSGRVHDPEIARNKKTKVAALKGSLFLVPVNSRSSEWTGGRAPKKYKNVKP